MKTNQSDTAKGYIWALTGTISFSGLYVFSKASLNEVSLAHFGLYYFGTAFILNILWLSISGKIKEIKSLSKSVLVMLFFLAIIDLGSNVAFFLSIKAIADPSVTSFLGNLFPVFLTILSIIFLKERFSRLEAFGGFLALAGAFVISYTGHWDWQKLFIPGTGMVVINTFLAATYSVLVKKNVQRASPEIFNLNSSGWIFIAFLSYFLVTGDKVNISPGAYPNIAIAAFLGAFLGLLSFYYSYRYIAASRSSIIQSLKGIFVLTIAYLYFGNLPLIIQIAGGAITISGVIIMTLTKDNPFHSGKTERS